MKKEKLMPILKWFLFCLLLLLFYVLQTMPGLFSLFGVKPVLILSLAVAVSMYEGVMASAFFSMTAGLLWDISSDRLFGFNGVILLCCGLLISLLCMYYLHTKVLNSLMFCSSIVLLQGLLDYTFYFAVWSLEDAWRILLFQILPTAAYTVAVTPLIFLLIKKIEFKLNNIPRV